MTIKYLLAVALVAPFLTVSSMAQTVDQHVYKGGPKTTIPHATRTTTASGAFAMVPSVVAPKPKHPQHVYSGGPQTVVPHSY
jgi:hypothetical protein